MSEYVTHFLDMETCQATIDTTGITPMATLCGLPVEAIIMNERPPTCHECHDIHASEGWTFPLPATVTA